MGLCGVLLLRPGSQHLPVYEAVTVLGLPQGQSLNEALPGITGAEASNCRVLLHGVITARGGCGYRKDT